MLAVFGQELVHFCYGVVVRLPSDVCFCEQPEIVRWDYETNEWRKDGFIDKLYNEGQCCIFSQPLQLSSRPHDNCCCTNLH